MSWQVFDRNKASYHCQKVVGPDLHLLFFDYNERFKDKSDYNVLNVEQEFCNEDHLQSCTDTCAFDTRFSHFRTLHHKFEILTSGMSCGRYRVLRLSSQANRRLFVILLYMLCFARKLIPWILHNLHEWIENHFIIRFFLVCRSFLVEFDRVYRNGDRRMIVCTMCWQYNIALFLLKCCIVIVVSVKWSIEQQKCILSCFCDLLSIYLCDVCLRVTNT